VKSGYVTRTKDVVRQYLLDALLIKNYDWTISWYVEGYCSGPLKQDLDRAGILLTETNPRTR